MVGENGSGKSTQLRVLSGELEATSGDVVKSAADLTVAVLRQEFVDELVLTRSLKDELISVYSSELRIVTDLRDAERELETCTVDEPDQMQAALDKLTNLNEEAEKRDVFNLKTRVEKVMNLMGFGQDDADSPVSSFSGGWKMRIG